MNQSSLSSLDEQAIVLDKKAVLLGSHTVSDSKSKYFLKQAAQELLFGLTLLNMGLGK